MNREPIIRPIPAAFGCVLRRTREAAGLSQRELARKARINSAYVGLLERGLQQPTISTLIKLAQGLNVASATLILDVHAQLSQGLTQPMPALRRPRARRGSAPLLE